MFRTCNHMPVDYGLRWLQRTQTIFALLQSAHVFYLAESSILSSKQKHPGPDVDLRGI